MKRIIFILCLLLAQLSAGARTQGIVTDTRQTAARNVVVRHEGFTASYNTSTLCPDWVAWEITRETTRGDASREDGEFTADPLVRGCAESRDYSRSGYDRGHMCPAADMKWSRKAMAESFYMSNICPQRNGLNAGSWLTLEKFCRWSANRFSKVWVACGPLYMDGLQVHFIGYEHKVRVPDAFFKVVLKQHTDGTYSAIGFIMENVEEQEADFQQFTSLSRHALTVGELERMTGLTFFTFLKDASVKNSYDLRHWGLMQRKR